MPEGNLLHTKISCGNIGLRTQLVKQNCFRGRLCRYRQESGSKYLKNAQKNINHVKLSSVVIL
jgi:hypothetical protein